VLGFIILVEFEENRWQIKSKNHTVIVFSSILFICFSSSSPPSSLPTEYVLSARHESRRGLSSRCL
jgi:hypothetical protein